MGTSAIHTMELVSDEKNDEKNKDCRKIDDGCKNKQLFRRLKKLQNELDSSQVTTAFEAHAKQLLVNKKTYEEEFTKSSLDDRLTDFIFDDMSQQFLEKSHTERSDTLIQLVEAKRRNAELKKELKKEQGVLRSGYYFIKNAAR